MCIKQVFAAHRCRQFTQNCAFGNKDLRPELLSQLSVCQFRRFGLLLEMFEVDFPQIKLSISAVKPL